MRRWFTALSKPGKVCTWGDGAHTKLGHATQGKILKPKVIESVSAIDAFAGPYHTFLLSPSGSLLGFGYNDYGQLGLGHIDEVTSPTEIISLTETIVKVACGLNYSLAVTEKGEVYEWGCPGKGQGFWGKLFRKPPQETLLNPTPRLLDSLPSDDPVTHIAAGDLHYLALTANSAVYAWGDNEFGACGTETILNEYKVPRRLEFFDKLPGGDKAVKVFACGASSGVLTAAGRVYMWGQNEKGQLGLAKKEDGYLNRLPIQPKPKLVEPNGNKAVLEMALGRYTSAFLSEDNTVQLAGSDEWFYPRTLCLPDSYHPTSLICGDDYYAMLDNSGLLMTLGGPFPGEDNRSDDIPPDVRTIKPDFFDGTVAKLVGPFDYCVAILA